MIRCYECETCGFHYEAKPRGPLPRHCTACKPAPKPSPVPYQRPITDQPRLIHALAAAVVDQRLAIEASRHALTLAALARQLGWDDRPWLQAAHDALHGITSVHEAAA